MSDNIRIEGDMITYRGEPMANIIRKPSTLREEFEHTITTGLCQDSYGRGWDDGYQERLDERLQEALEE